MTDSKSKVNKRDVHLWLALGIALAALLLRVWLVNFPTGSHDDEPIIANLSARFVEQGILTADWAGFNDQAWSRPTYQFSPYTLLQSVIAKMVSRVFALRPGLDSYILLARIASCCWGSLAVLLVFFLGRTCFSPQAALLGEATLATCFLQVQDSIYARVDAFLGCLVLLSLVLAFQAAKRPGSFYWLAATSFTAGVTIAAKYNAFPVLVLIPFILFRWTQAGAISRGRMVLLAIASLSFIGVGFIFATPQLLWRPAPLIAGLQYESSHYSTGHIPHQAHDWDDNNLFYWIRYLAWLGLGLLQTFFAFLFIFRIVKLRRWEDYMLGAFLAVSALLILVTKVRFERNLEICLGSLALVASVTAWDFICWINRRQNSAMARFLCIVFVTVWFLQPLRVLGHFRETLDYHRDWRIMLTDLRSKNGAAVVIPLINTNEPSLSSVAGFPQLFLVDYGDPFSAESAMRWKRALHAEPDFVLASPWYKYNYPFSTVNVYHGPLLTLVYLRGAKSTPVGPAKSK